jgi:ribosomal protein S18 acetylase RimI-like enzyme
MGPIQVNYRDDVRPPAATIIPLYRDSLLNRPIEDPARIQQSFDASNIVWTAWIGDRLAGILRAWSDGARDGYICDLAVHPDFQKLGIGRELLDRVVASDRRVQFVLRASIIAVDYYAHLGWQKMDNGWFVPRES